MTEPCINLTLMSRAYCHLCHDMEAALRPLLAEYGAALQVWDVDAAPALEAQYDELVPVLLLDGVEICHYFLDEAKVRAVLAGVR
ncbi:MAG: glutaredoxin family protein [Zoogloeaceae bacterium]|jgi:thioredoxin reductase (NADPH)|nr:glutaredoxin family protein [Zoogloeaceae bacterium]